MNKKMKISLPAALIPIAVVGVLYGFSGTASADDTTTGLTVSSTSCSYALSVPASVTLVGAAYVGSADTFSVVSTAMSLKSGGDGDPLNACGWSGGTGASLSMTLAGTGFAGASGSENYDTLLSTAPLIVTPDATGCTAEAGNVGLSWSSTTPPTYAGAFATLLHVGTTQTCTFSTTYSFTIPSGKTPAASPIVLTGPILTTTNTVT
jgi:hypothetical protein